MKTIEGHDVKIFTDNVEPLALEQIERLLSIDVFGGCKIRVMPDVHAGAGCVIGFTGNLGDKVIPNIVGVDIGCGILVQPFECRGEVDFHALNAFIVENIPSGWEVRDKGEMILPHDYMERYQTAKELVKRLRCYRELKDCKRIYKGIGTLGGGNHYIEVDRDENGKTYLMVHTGSRNLGKQVAKIYQKTAIKNQSGWAEMMEEQKRIIEEYKVAGRKSELREVITRLHSSFKMRPPRIPEDLCYLEGESRADYLYDMRLCQEWAQINRRLIVDLLVDHLIRSGNISADRGKLVEDTFESVHNYIGDDNVIRKGAISASKGQRCVIPLNMRDGALVCIGKGNADWNHSAPHGAGRLMSRAQAFREISLDDYTKSMDGIYSETVTEKTKDESPMVYKPKEEIITNIRETVDIVNVIKPVFNFKAAE
ncbi:MAG: RtcB family protein [Candidatus Phocaeicola excrementipullorum]|uniref:3'-phosphate/5'-hydroxy nucleic acid ligase n=1 Tax=Candidatus Phocaeicola excrementipullorum TaxID=2838731 RepID=A0A948X389_9BACT|nr:RtcB family protein [Candidatus Phocaeicola excrementipullorum]